jgi:hypothetical protein
MHPLSTLIAAYERHGYTISTGLNPFHFHGERIVSYSRLFRDGSVRSTGAGISLQECYLVEALSGCFEPERIFVVGNAFGWSTLFLSLVFPKARVVAIDSLVEGDEARAGFDLTLELTKELELAVEVVEGTSPGDVAAIVGERFGQIDLALVDGLHTNEQQWLDYEAIKPLLADPCLVLFHDVLDWDMVRSFERIQADWSGSSTLLHRTPSGMGMLHSESLREALDPIYRMFVEARLEALDPVPILSGQYMPGQKPKSRSRRTLRKRIKKLVRRLA